MFFSVLQLVGLGGTRGIAKPATFSSLRGRAEVKSSVGFNSNFGLNTHKPPPGPGVNSCASLASGDFESSGMYKAEAWCQPLRLSGSMPSCVCTCMCGADCCWRSRDSEWPERLELGWSVKKKTPEAV